MTLIRKILSGKYWKWLAGIIILLIPFYFGYQTAATFYDNKIDNLREQHAKQLIKFQDQVITQTTRYNSEISRLSKEMGRLKEGLINETKQPEYQCAIPDDGIRMLNDAINQANQQ